jgi:hypothetical protein
MEIFANLNGGFTTDTISPESQIPLNHAIGYLCEMLWDWVRIYRPCKLGSAVVANIFDLDTFVN